jgi:hypothetical protein
MMADMTQPCSAMADTSHDGRCIVVMWCGGSYATVAWHDGRRTCGMAAATWQLCGVMVVVHWPCCMAVVVLRLWWGCGGGCAMLRWLHGMAAAGGCMAWWWRQQSCCGGCSMAVAAVAAATPWQRQRSCHAAMATWHDGGSSLSRHGAAVRGQRHGPSSYEAHSDMACAAVREVANGLCSCKACGDVACAAAREALTWPIQLQGTQRHGMPSCKGGSDVAGAAEREAPTWPT